MCKTTALLVGVSYYSFGGNNLEECKKDLAAVKEGLISGLNVNSEDIFIVGENGYAFREDIKTSVEEILHTTCEDDIFIFYFSGHGGKNKLALSNELITFNDLENLLNTISAKRKIIIIDSCHSGSFYPKDMSKGEFKNSIESFIGKGYAVLASCPENETSTFNYERGISLYTSFLCDALSLNFLIKKGRKSLEDINDAIFHIANLSSKKGRKFQQPIFRSSIAGDIYFNVKDYNPYKTEKVYEENDRYIIYDVEPLHNLSAKRYSVKVIIRCPMELEEIAKISNEVNAKLQYCDIYKTKHQEQLWLRKPVNKMYCYFAMDEEDIFNGNFICSTEWNDKDEYSQTKNSCFIAGTYIVKNPNHNIVKQYIEHTTANETDIISLINDSTRSMVECAEESIRLFHEYLNGSFSENELSTLLSPINKRISKLYIEQSDYNIPPSKIHDWAQLRFNLCSTISDFSLFYNNENQTKWSKDEKIRLFKLTIERYHKNLEKIKED